MFMKYRCLIICVFILLITLPTSQCIFGKVKKENQHFSRDGVTFSIAADWKVIANDSIGNNAFYFSAERTGENATGIITITWINKTDDPVEIMKINQRTMKASNTYRNPGIEFTATEPDNFADQKVQSCRYLTFVKEQKLEGKIYTFNISAKTISIFLQTGIDDKKENQKAFELLQKTFNCVE